MMDAATRFIHLRRCFHVFAERYHFIAIVYCIRFDETVKLLVLTIQADHTSAQVGSSVSFEINSASYLLSALFRIIDCMDNVLW